MPIETPVASNDLADLPTPEAMEAYEKERNAIIDFADEENELSEEQEPTQEQFDTLLDKLKQFNDTKQAMSALHEMAHAEDPNPQYAKQYRPDPDVKLMIMSDYDVHDEAHVGEMDANLGTNGERLVITVNGSDARADISLCDGTNVVTIENFSGKQLVKLTKALMKLVDEMDLHDYRGMRGPKGPTGPVGSPGPIGPKGPSTGFQNPYKNALCRN